MWPGRDWDWRSPRRRSAAVQPRPHWAVRGAGLASASGAAFYSVRVRRGSPPSSGRESSGTCTSGLGGRLLGRRAGSSTPGLPTFRRWQSGRRRLRCCRRRCGPARRGRFSSGWLCVSAVLSFWSISPGRRLDPRSSGVFFVRYPEKWLFFRRSRPSPPPGSHPRPDLVPGIGVPHGWPPEDAAAIAALSWAAWGSDWDAPERAWANTRLVANRRTGVSPANPGRSSPAIRGELALAGRSPRRRDPLRQVGLPGVPRRLAAALCRPPCSSIFSSHSEFRSPNTATHYDAAPAAASKPPPGLRGRFYFDRRDGSRSRPAPPRSRPAMWGVESRGQQRHRPLLAAALLPSFGRALASGFPFSGPRARSRSVRGRRDRRLDDRSFRRRPPPDRFFSPRRTGGPGGVRDRGRHAFSAGAGSAPGIRRGGGAPRDPGSPVRRGGDRRRRRRSTGNGDLPGAAAIFKGTRGGPITRGSASTRGEESSPFAPRPGIRTG